MTIPYPFYPDPVLVPVRYPFYPYYAQVFKDWEKIKTWFKDINATVATTFKGIPHAAITTIKPLKEDMARLLYKLYYKYDDHYVEEVRTAFIAVEELPDGLKAKLDSGEEVDITDEIESELHLTL